MPTPPVDQALSARFKLAIEKRLLTGYTPFRASGGLGSSILAAAKDLGITGDRLKRWTLTQLKNQKAGKDNFVPNWALFNRSATTFAEPRKRAARRFLLTAAQNDTAVHERFWTSLRTYADHVGADILVGPFTYQLGTFTDHTSRHNVFAEAVRPNLEFESHDCGPVIFCAEMNTLPTAARPLSGLHTYTRGRPGVFPHAKLALESIPAMPGKQPPIIMTTGCCTIENYVAKKAGLKAAFHHVIGATMVEINERGQHFCRQINALEDGSFQDLDCQVSGSKVTPGKRVAAINWGDIHARKMNADVANGSWYGDDAMIDVLRPAYQFYHDLFDGDSISHWLEQKPHKRYELHVKGQLDVAEEIQEAAKFVRATQREFCRTVIIESNHDLWAERWLQTADPWRDLINAEAYHRWNLAALIARRLDDKTFSIFRYALREADGNNLEGIEFVPVGTSFEICRDRGGIECGAHGHLGSNGSRGTSRNLSMVATKMNKGHDHTASIVDGVYSAGVCGPNPDLLLGPSSWTPSHIVTYESGKRSVVTMHGCEWRA